MATDEGLGVNKDLAVLHGNREDRVGGLNLGFG